MSFASPIYLLALLVIPAGILLARAAKARRARHAVRLPAASGLAALLPKEATWMRVLPAGFFAAAVGFLALALAKPQVTVAEPVERATVMLVTDSSGSMRATDVDPSRLQAAVSAVGDFLTAVPKPMKVGLITYSGGVSTLATPTTDRQAVRDAAGTIVADGATATGDALAEALTRLRPDPKDPNPAPAAILLLSDGMTSQGVDPLEIARQAKKANISISTVALGTPDGTVQLGPGGPYRSVPPDPETLAQIAKISGGQAFTAENSGDLKNVYKKVGSKLGTKPVKREATAGAAGLAAVFLGAAMVLMLRRRSRLG